MRAADLLRALAWDFRRQAHALATRADELDDVTADTLLKAFESAGVSLPDYGAKINNAMRVCTPRPRGITDCCNGIFSHAATRTRSTSSRQRLRSREFSQWRRQSL